MQAGERMNRATDPIIYLYAWNNHHSDMRFIGKVWINDEAWVYNDTIDPTPIEDYGNWLSSPTPIDNPFDEWSKLYSIDHPE